MNDDIRKQIILKLIHNPEARFSDLWDKDIESNAFSYHLKKLEGEGLVEKSDDVYRLTEQGKKLTLFIEGDTGDKAALPMPTVVVIAIDNDKILAQRRLKEPFYGCLGFISGKINFGLNVLECAKRDLMEEAGLEADLELKGLTMAKTYNDGKLVFHHFLHYVAARNPRGMLITNTHKAENFWTRPVDTKDQERFPDYDELIELVSGDRFFIREVERFQENGKFVGFKVVSERYL